MAETIAVAVKKIREDITKALMSFIASVWAAGIYYLYVVVDGIEPKLALSMCLSMSIILLCTSIVYFISAYAKFDHYQHDDK